MNFLRLALTQSATLLGLTPAIVGFALARGVGMHTAIWSMLLACFITCTFAALSASLAVVYRQPTAPLSGLLLGPTGPRLVGIALAVSAIGFFGVHMMALMQALPALMPQAPSAWPKAPVVLLSATCSIALVWRGNARIAGINGVQAPLLVLAVAWAARQQGDTPQGTPLFSQRISVDAACVAMVVAAGLGDVVDLPSVMHRARSQLDAIVAAFLTYGIVLPSLLVAGTYLARDVAAPSALFALANGSAGWRVAVCLLAISCATVGNANLVYSGSLSVAAAQGRAPTSWHRLVVGAAAALLSLTPLSDRLPPLLDGLGLATGAVGTTLLCNFLLDGTQKVVAPSRARTRGSALACVVGALSGALLFAFKRGEDTAAAVAIACGVACAATMLTRATARAQNGLPRGG